MASDPSNPVFPPLAGGGPAEAVPRLAEQLQALSQVAETLTYRLLELEERLASQEQRFEPLLEGATEADSRQVEEMDLRLGDTEERLSRIEAVLGGLDPSADRWAQPPSVGRGLRAVAPAAAVVGPAGAADDFLAEPDEEIDPFPEEGEQPFMDERIA